MSDTSGAIGYVMEKGEKYDMVKPDGSPINEIDFYGGWDINANAGVDPDEADFDGDISAGFLDGQGEKAQVLGREWIVFPWNKRTPNGEFVLDKDNTTGEGEGPDETISGKLLALPDSVRCVRYWLNIFKGKERKQNFGMMDNLFVGIRDRSTGLEICRYLPGDSFARHRCMVVAEHYRLDDNVWKFKAIGRAVVEPDDIKSEYVKVGIPIK